MPTSHAERSRYWADLLLSLRSSRNWSQTQLAEALETNQETVSRWERGMMVPSRRKQDAIEHLAESCNISSLGAVAHIVRLSPYPMLLCDGSDTVVAASKASGFTEGRSVTAQTPEAQHEYYTSFSRDLVASGFWADSGNCRHYEFAAPDGITFRAVLVSIRIQRSVYCVVQAIPQA